MRVRRPGCFSVALFHVSTQLGCNGGEQELHGVLPGVQADRQLITHSKKKRGGGNSWKVVSGWRWWSDRRGGGGHQRLHLLNILYSPEQGEVE